MGLSLRASPSAGFWLYLSYAASVEWAISSLDFTIGEGASDICTLNGPLAFN